MSGQPSGGRGAVAAEERPDPPGWRLWRSSSGRSWATRVAPGSRFEELPDGSDVPMTLDADTDAGVRDLVAGYPLKRD